MDYQKLLDTTEQILILRGGPTSGNWGHAGRKGKKGGSGKGGGFKRIGIKDGKKAGRKGIKRASRQTRAKDERKRGGGVPKKSVKIKNGSEKQIKWAEDIISQSKDRMDRRLEKAEGRKAGMIKNGTYTKTEKIFHDVISATAPAIKTELDRFDDARDIIEKRGTIRREAFIKVVKSGVAKPQIDAFLKTGGMTKKQVFDFIIG